MLAGRVFACQESKVFYARLSHVRSAIKSDYYEACLMAVCQKLICRLREWGNSERYKLI